MKLQWLMRTRSLHNHNCFSCGEQVVCQVKGCQGPKWETFSLPRDRTVTVDVQAPAGCDACFSDRKFFLTTEETRVESSCG